jgi:hypothetical protein
LNAGGLVGFMIGGSVDNSYATGKVTGDRAGGLVGTTSNGVAVTISDSYATGEVVGNIAGGLVGMVGFGSSGAQTIISNSYYNGENAEQGIGGYYHSGGTIDNNNMDGLTVDVQSLNTEELAYTDQLISGSMTLDDVKTDIANIKEQARIEQEERERQEQIRLANEAEQQRLSALALNSGEAIRVTAEKEQKANEGLFFNLGNNSPTINDILASNVIINNGNYTADIKTITVDGVVYILNEEEDK